MQSSSLHLATPLCQENFTNDLESLFDFSETLQDHDVRNPGPDFLSVFLLRLQDLIHFISDLLLYLLAIRLEHLELIVCFIEHETTVFCDCLLLFETLEDLALLLLSGLGGKFDKVPISFEIVGGGCSIVEKWPASVWV